MSKCACCNSTGKMTVDHIVPRGLGGSDRQSNTQKLCSHCNARKNVLETLVSGIVRGHGLPEYQARAYVLDNWRRHCAWANHIVPLKGILCGCPVCLNLRATHAGALSRWYDYQVFMHDQGLLV